MTIIQLADGIMRRVCGLQHKVFHLQTSQDSSVADLKADLRSIADQQAANARQQADAEVRLAEIQVTLARIAAAVIEPDQAASISLTVMTQQ